MTLTAGNHYFLWAPTYLEQHEESYDYVRNAQNVYFRGVQDRVFLSASFAFTWRRVCFFSYEQFVPALPFFIEAPVDTDPQIMRRPLRRITLTQRRTFFRMLGRVLSVLISLRTLDGMPLLMINFLLLFMIGRSPLIPITLLPMVPLTGSL